MCNVEPEKIYILCHILHCFEAISGLKVSLQKPELVAVKEVPHQEELADILNYSISSLQMKHLWLSLGASFKSKAIWERVVEKMKKRLARWKKIYMSWGGHLTLIKSTLSSLPTYFFPLFPLSGDVARRLERLQKDFFGMDHEVSLSFF